jgi:hypothetical protein
VTGGLDNEVIGEDEDEDGMEELEISGTELLE